MPKKTTGVRSLFPTPAGPLGGLFFAIPYARKDDRNPHLDHYAIAGGWLKLF